MVQATLDRHYDQPDDRRNERSDDEHVDVIGRNQGVPIRAEITENGYVVKVHKVDEFQVRDELDSEDVGVEDQRQDGRVDIVRNEDAPEDKHIFFGDSVGSQQFLRDDCDEYAEDYVGD